MKRIKLFNCIALVLTFTFLCSFPDAQQALQLTYGGTGNDQAYDIVDAGNNQFYVIGNSNSGGGAGGYDIVVTKMQKDGTVLWSQLYGQGGDETVRKASKTSDGGLVLTGQTTSFNGHKGDILCMKLTKYGGVEWMTEYGNGTQYGDLGMDIIQTSDGGYAVSAILNVHGFVANAIVMKLNSQGTAVWYKTFDRGDGEDGVGIIEQGNTLIATSDIQHSVAGGNYTMVITKLDEATGNVISAKSLVPAERGIFNPHIFKDNANGYWISGHMIDSKGILGATYDKMQQTILKLDANFNVVKSYKLAVSPYTDNYFTGFVPLADGGFVTCAATQTPSSSNVYRFDANGKVVFSKTISGGGGARQLNRLQLIGSNVVCVGSDAVSGASDIFVTSFDIGGNTSTACGYDTALVAVNNETYTASNFTWPITTTTPIAGAVENLAAANFGYPPNISTCVKQVTVTPNFTIPDTVCVNSPVNITNTTTGASSYFWSFCTADINQPPTGNNLGNPGGSLKTPVYIDYVFEKGNYYGFATNNFPGGLVRLDFGSSLLNTPTTTDLGTVNGAIPANTEGVQIVNNQGKWYVLVVGGDVADGSTPSLVTVSLGTDIANNNPSAVNWGNIGDLAYPHDLYVFQDNSHWYGMTANYSNSTITRFDFGTSFDNAPGGLNLGNKGQLSGPTGLHALKDNSNKWHVFVTNATSNTLSRLDFDNSLLNTPTGFNLGDPDNTFSTCWDIYVIKYCGSSIAYVINATSNTISKLDFNGDITSNTLTAVNFGNIGNLNFPHCLSKLFRVGANVYSLITNVIDNSITRLQFEGCTNASTPNSTKQNPPAVTYSTPGVYNINLTVDDSLPTQNSLCKQVVVVSAPKISITGETSICKGDSAYLKATGGTSYSWLPTAGIANPNSASIAVKPTSDTKYFVTGKNAAGCVSKDSVTVKLNNCTVCNTWLNIPDKTSSVRIGDLDVSGDQITVEANFTNTNGLADDVVSKHRDFGDVNYLLRPYRAEITTTSGYVATPQVCDIEPNKTYHIAMVYDGKALKFYRNGYLMSQVPETGNMILNDWVTTIGNFAFDPSGNGLVEPLIGYINNVRIWNVARTQAQIQQYMNAPLPNPQNQQGLLAYYTFDNLKNKQGNTAWDGKTLGNASILADNPICPNFVADSCDIVPAHCSVNPDFSFKQDVCNPSSFQFTNETQQVSSVSWDFGNGLKAGNNLTPSVNYSIYGSYKVMLVVQTVDGCTDSVSKNIAVNFTRDSIIVNRDTLLCKNTSLQLNALPALSYCWSPSTGLSATNIANPVATVTKNTTYHLSSQTVGSNLIVNGDFSLGNIGFNSGYSYTAVNTTEGQYYVGKNPNGWNGGMSACSDHTGSSGSMMLVNGNPTPDLKVWSETITVKPNTNYAFSAWLQPVFGVNPASLQFYINGKTIGNIFNAELPTCNWKQFFVTWNSGDTDKADISIINKNIEILGNDFALDDISFAEVNIKYDSVNIKVDSVAVKVSPNTSICAGNSLQIQATVSPNSTFNWSPSVSLSSPVDLSPIASPASTTTYVINVTSAQGCSNKDSVTITVLQQPTVKTIADTAICTGMPVQLTTTVTNSNTISWSPSGGLSDATQQNPVANPTSNTKYIITVNPGTQCSVQDSVTVAVKPVPAIQVSNDTTLCSGASAHLVATSAGAVFYSWSPPGTLDDASSNNPTSTPANTTKYFVQVTGTNGCNSTDSITVSVLPQPTVATIADTALCSGSSVQLITNVANGNTYNWNPAKDLSDPNVQSPIASPSGNIQYIITVNPGSQCAVQDTVNIAVNPLPAVQAFGDTTLCAGSGSQLTAVSGDNVTYSWSPVAGLDNSLANNPIASPTATTIYTVQVTDVKRCTANDAVTVTVIPKPVFAIDPSSKQICVGDPLTLNASGGDIYQWYPTETVVNPTSASTQVNPLTNTTYNVIITNNTCKLKDTVSSVITVNAKMSTSVTKSNDVDCVIGSAMLQATGGNQYAWSPVVTLDHPAIANPTATPLETTTYYVTIKKNGCTVIDSITVNVIVRNADNGYKMPSAFTPNGDNVNDCFGLKYWGGIKTLEFAVYNRWGNRVFYTNDPSKCWDGTFNGTPQPTGTFVYQIKAATICGYIYRKGTVVLIR